MMKFVVGVDQLPSNMYTIEAYASHDPDIVFALQNKYALKY